MTDRGDRGVSEVVGFVFVFAIVILSVVLVGVTGYAGLQSSRDAERVDSAERGFDVLADNVDDVVRRGAPSRTTEFRVAGDDISVGEPVVVSVSGHPVGDPTTTTFDEQYALGTIVYDSGGDARLTYVAGAVVRTDRGGTVMLREPDLLVSGNATTLVLGQPRASDAVGVGGSGNAHLRVTADQPVLAIAEPTPQVVTVSVTSPNVEAWHDYVQRLDAADPAVSCGSPVDDTVSCTVTTDRTYVTTVGVEVRFD